MILYFFFTFAGEIPKIFICLIYKTDFAPKKSFDIPEYSFRICVSLPILRGYAINYKPLGILAKSVTMFSPTQKKKGQFNHSTFIKLSP